MFIIWIIFASNFITNTKSAEQPIYNETMFNMDVIQSVFVDTKCVQIVVHSSFAEMTSSHQYIFRSISDLLAQNIYEHDANVFRRQFHALAECGLTLINADVTNVFSDTNEADSFKKYKRFRPHSRIVVLAATSPTWTKELRVFIKRHALHVVWLVENSVYRMGCDGLQQTNTSNSAFWQFMHIDPVTELSVSGFKDALIVSMFNCEPYIMITYDDQNNDTHHIDGIEYRLIRMLDQYFTLHFQVAAFNSYSWDPYAINQVRKRQADIAMCSPWLEHNSYVEFDLTTVVNFQCGTFLVPKPQAINAANYVYMSLSQKVWLLGLISFGLIAVLMFCLARWLQPGRYADGVRIVFDLICICTNHGLDTLPSEQSRVIRMLLVVWLFGTTLLGVGYSTGYTALLSSPVYTEPVDTVADYLAQPDYVWSYVGNVCDFRDLEKSIDMYRRLYQRIEYVASAAEQTKMILTGDRQITVYVAVIFDRYIVYAKDLLRNRVRSMRMMKSCWYGHYTTLALYKYSAYRALLDDIIVK